ncbi:multidrug resistance efflux pump [Bradyrhizobium sp. LM3.4]
MKGNFAWLGRLALTALAIVAALAVGRELWVYYMEQPWTRDGRVRADVVQVAPDVSGFVDRSAGEGQPEGSSRRRVVPDRP